MTELQILAGLIVSKVKKVHDYIQVVFSGGATLSIFNNHTYDGGSVLSINGKKVKSVAESENAFIIFFDSGESLSVGLNYDDYNGPEAMVLRREGTSLIVWS